MKKPNRFYIIPGMMVRIVFDDETSVVMSLDEAEKMYGNQL
jgi:hypothetical protein